MVLHIMLEDSLELVHYEFVKIIVKLQLQAFGRNFENWKMQNFRSCLQDL